MYNDAARYSRSLLLDVTSPAVTAAGNIYTKAMNLLRLHPHAVVIVVSGREIWRKCGPDAQPVDPTKLAEYRRALASTGRNKNFSTVLSQIDIDFPSSPIFVFGYSQMQRGISYRSAMRVPSHMILDFKKAMSLCRLVQAAGRSNGKQAAQLMENMNLQRPTVRLLTSSNDFDAIRNYPRFLEAIRQNMETHDMNLEEALNANYPGRYDFEAARQAGAARARVSVDAPLVFDDVTDDELFRDLPGAFYQMTNLPGLMHMLLTVLRDADAVDSADDNGINITEIREELEAAPDYHNLMDDETRNLMESLDTAAQRARIRAALDEMLKSRTSVQPRTPAHSRTGHLNARICAHSVVLTTDFESPAQWWSGQTSGARFGGQSRSGESASLKSRRKGSRRRKRRGRHRKRRARETQLVPSAWGHSQAESLLPLHATTTSI